MKTFHLDYVTGQWIATTETGEKIVCIEDRDAAVRFARNLARSKSVMVVVHRAYPNLDAVYTCEGGSTSVTFRWQGARSAKATVASKRRRPRTDGLKSVLGNPSTPCG